MRHGSTFGRSATAAAWLMAAGGGLLVIFLTFGCTPAAARTQPVEIEAALDTPVVLGGSPRRAFLRVALRGAEMERTRPRAAVNLAIVLDRSGSMSGEKLAEARSAAIMAIDRLAADDIVSVVAYDDTVETLASAIRVGDADALRRRIAGLEPGGSTALFAGVAKGAHEVRRQLAVDRVNRVILLSDGLANVGPSSPGELAELGSSLGREGIAVTTIGLGLDYNEELMTRLAATSDGNHFFAERAEDLAKVYEAELGEVLSILAQEVEVTVRFAPGVRPVRILGREAEIRGNTVVGHLNQLYARQTKYFLVEVELPQRAAGGRGEIGEVETRYLDLATRERVTRIEKPFWTATDRQAAVEAARNPRVTAAVARQIGTESNLAAMVLRDQGRIEEAKSMLLANASYLESAASLTDSKHLAQDAAENRSAAENLSPEEWQRQRKVMSKEQIDKLQALGYVE